MRTRLTLALLFSCCATSFVPGQSNDRPFAIRDVRVFDGDTVTERQAVVVRGASIEAVGAVDSIALPPGADVIPGEGRTLLPGLIDAHVHVSALWPVEALQQALAFGVTTVFDMWSGPPPPGWTGRPAFSRLKEIETADAPDLAAVRSAGTGATAPGGHPTQMDGGWPAKVVPTLSAPSEADAFVAARLAEGSDFIKIIYDDANESFGFNLPTLSEETIAALVRAVHSRGHLAVAHIGSERHARGAIAAGVDGLVHLFVGRSVSGDFGRFAADHGVFVIPTMSVLYPLCRKSSAASILNDAEAQKYIHQQFRSALTTNSVQSDRSCDATTQAIRQLAEAKVPLLAGTDAPALGTTYGASLHRELELLVDAGITPAAALAAATSAPARAFRLNDRGRIRSGLRADLILVEGDPSKQIRDTRNIVAIWKQGVRLQRMP